MTAYEMELNADIGTLSEAVSKSDLRCKKFWIMLLNTIFMMI